MFLQEYPSSERTAFAELHGSYHRMETIHHNLNHDVIAASAAAAIAAATSSATAGAFALASGLAQLGGTTGLKTNNRLSPRPTSTSQQPNDEMYDITSPMVPNMYEDSSSK